ncbi:CbtA family protein [Streptomyces sp. NPDC016309]|uniref:CbtA family protein n=1 Tax=Streptomyces sp. NPDC016309 TaxID=3364965 RepID=UPI0036F6B6E5
MGRQGGERHGLAVPGGVAAVVGEASVREPYVPAPAVGGERDHHVIVRTLLVRGVIAGVLAGRLAFGLASVIGEPPVDAAIAVGQLERRGGGECRLRSGRRARPGTAARPGCQGKGGAVSEAAAAVH